jgi:nicotinamidase-related amidase
MRIVPDDCCALLIDVQERLYPHIHEHEPMLARIQVLFKGLELLHIPWLVSEQYVKGLGPTLPALLPFLATHSPIEKMSFSCCDEPRLLMKLHEFQRNTVIIAGIEAHVCVLQTVIDLKENGYTPVVVADAVSSRRPLDKQVALDRMKREGALLTTTESLLLELCRSSGTELFKSISALIK